MTWTQVKTTESATSAPTDPPGTTYEGAQPRERTPWLLGFLCFLIPVLPAFVVLPGPLKSNGSPALMIAVMLLGLVVLGFVMVRRTAHAPRVSPGATVLLTLSPALADDLRSRPPPLRSIAGTVSRPVEHDPLAHQFDRQCRHRTVCPREGPNRAAAQHRARVPRRRPDVRLSCRPTPNCHFYRLAVPISATGICPQRRRGVLG